MAVGKTIFFKRLAGGSLSLYLQDVDGILPARWFVMDHKVPRIGVPSNYALSIFLDSNLENILKKNYFEIEKVEEFLTLAEEKGYISTQTQEVKEIATPKRSKEMLLAILKGGKEEKIKELFSSNDRKRALEIAIEHSKDLSIDIVGKIESVVGMAITQD